MYQSIIDALSSIPVYLSALLAATFTWLMTTLGAAVVFMFKKIHRRTMDITLGVAGGVMLAAGFFSLLNPAFEMAEKLPYPAWVAPSVGFVLGALFLYVLDRAIPHLHPNMTDGTPDGKPSSLHRSTLLILAITLHNIPEGLAVGVAFGAVATGMEGATIGAAVSLAIGMGLQNVPEGMAVSTPLRALGWGRTKSFLYGQATAIVEPISAVVGAVAVVVFSPLLPYILSFAAGAMIYVVVEEVIPETQRDKYADSAVLGLIAGFVLMMILDTSL